MSAEQLQTIPSPTDVKRLQEAHGQPPVEAVQTGSEAAAPAEHEIEVTEVPSASTVVVTTRERGGVSRPQGAPENSTATGEITVGAAKNVELSDSARPVASNRKRGGAERPQGPSKRAELDQHLDKEERRLRLVLGSRAVERAGADYVRGEAIRKLKAKGHDVSSLEPKKVVETSGSPLFDELASKYAAADRDITSSLPKSTETPQPKHRKEIGDTTITTESDQTAADKVPEGFPADVWADLSADERQRARDAWDNYSEEEKTKAFNKRIIPAMKPQPGRHKKEAAEKAEARHKKQRVTMRDRFRNLMAAAGAKLSVAQVESKKYFDDEEKGGRRRTTARVVGAAAVLAAGVGVAYGLHDLLTSGDAGTAVGHAHKPKPEHVVKGHEIASKYHREVLHSGDTYWGDTVKAHPHATEAQIHELVAKELKQDGLTWEDARHLPVGTRVSIR